MFELTRTAKGGWEEKVLHSFAGGADGENPQSGLIFDPAGNVYGTTAGNVGACTHPPSAAACGTVFSLAPRATGPWVERVLHRFNYNGTDGYFPYGSLVFDAAGNLYGGTYDGGTYYDGIAFELTPNNRGGWTEKILYSFYWGKGVNGGGPGGLIFDAAGNLYGTTAAGGASNWGAVFELSPSAGGTWTQTILHSFYPNVTDGGVVNDGLVFDAAGNLYGTTRYGGAGTVTCIAWGGGNNTASCGTVFELTLAGSESILHNFGNGTDGEIPNGALIRDAAGNLYGTSRLGGTGTTGMAFEITP